ncbi:seminase [Drosophila takahashii]|uniref:seminase n=1 Tax=Drosophila takahashii TaxID=29030 RepID=UPI001CF888CC|nr:seminase [Drosophila takahashii]
MQSLLYCCVLAGALISIHVHGQDTNRTLSLANETGAVKNYTIDVKKLAKIVLPPDHDPRVIGGQITTNAKLGGYLMALLYGRDFVCGGALIHELIVLTAAHCFLGRMKVAQWTVVGGISKLHQRGLRRQVKDFIISEKFEEDEMNMDVAVMLMKSPMKGKGIGKLSLCSVALNPGIELVVSGWGMTVARGRGPQPLLRTVTVPIIQKKKCRSAYQPMAKITDSMLCAAVLGKKDACTFDSGGPLVYKKQVCGIVSFGIGCASKRYPGVYTDVIYVKPFIEKSMKVLLAKK